MMKAAVKFDSGPGNFTIKDVPVPSTGDNDVLIEVKKAAVCGADGMLYDWTYKGRFPVKTPRTLGHECSGIVVEKGKDVGGFEIGDRVTAESIIGCGQCYYCLRGMGNMCPSWDHLGITMDGTFAQYILVPARALHRLPEAVSFSQGALVEPLAITANTFDRIKMSIGENVVIVGPGVQGLLHTQVARAGGAAKIIVAGLGRDSKRLEMARSFGADHVIYSDKEGAAEEILELTDGIGADLVIEVGGTPEAVSLAYAVVRGGGNIAALGYSPHAEVEPLKIARQQITVTGIIGFVSRHFEYAIGWMASNKVDVEAIISHRLTLDETETGIQLMKESQATKVLLNVGL